MTVVVSALGATLYERGFGDISGLVDVALLESTGKLVAPVPRPR